jgi:hypothetical protein
MAAMRRSDFVAIAARAMRHIVDYARKRASVVKGIQQSSLSRLSRLHRRTLQDLDVAVRNLERFSSDQYLRRITSDSPRTVRSNS